MVIAISMVRDEADIVESTVRHMATQVDRLVIADNRSQDGTRDLLEALSKELPLTVLDEPQVGYYQSQAMTELARRAEANGAEWIVPFDADEWHYSPHGRIADVLHDCRGEIVMAPCYNHVATGEDSPEQTDPVVRLRWRERAPYHLPKVVCRASPDLTIGQGNHTVSYGREVDRVRGKLAIRHFPYRSPEQFERKIRNGAAAIKATGFVESVCIHWRTYGAALEADGPQGLERVFYEHHYRQDPRADVPGGDERPGPLVLDPAPGSD